MFKKNFLIIYFNLFSFISCAQNTYEVPSDYRIHLHEDDVTIENGRGEARSIIDEEGMINENGLLILDPKTKSDIGFKPFHFPSSIIIQLKANLNVSYLHLFLKKNDLHASDSVIIYVGKPFEWTEITVLKNGLINGWNVIAINKNTEAVKIQFSGKSLELYECHLYSKDKIEQIVQHNPISRKKRIYMDEMIGVNCFVDDPPGLLKVAGWVREYHNWYWTDLNEDTLVYPNNRYRFNPAIGFNFDLFYKNLNSMGIDPVPCIKSNLEYLRPKKWLKVSKPATKGMDSSDPNAYQAHSNHIFTYAHRYGRGDGVIYTPNLANNQVPEAHLGYIDYIENWNEPDNWWKGKHSHFHPFEYAAMSSMDYDANNLDARFLGIKNADAQSKLVMAGTAGLRLEYVKSMKLWADYYRNGDLPVDVLNFHFGAREEDGEFKKAIMPEKFELSSKLDELVGYRDRNFGDRELWLSEFGYDEHPKSIQGLPKQSNYSSEEYQAIGIIRHYLIISTKNIERASMYMLRDAGTGSEGIYATSGLVQDKNRGWRRKVGWYYLHTLKTILQGKYFVEEIIHEPLGKRVIKYTNDSETINVYAFWTSKAASNSSNRISFKPEFRTGTLYKVELTRDSLFGVHTKLGLRSGSLELKLTEKPFFIIEYKKGAPPERYYYDDFVKLDSSMLTSDQKMVSLLVDEQDHVSDLIFNTSFKPKTKWNSSKKESYPQDITINLYETKEISWIGFFDSNGNDNFEVLNSNNDQVLFNDRLKYRNRWNIHKVDHLTDQLLLRFHGFNARISEFVLFERKELIIHQP